MILPYAVTLVFLSTQNWHLNLFILLPYVYLTETGWRVLLPALNKLHSKLIAQGRYTDAIDEIPMKMAGYRLNYVPGKDGYAKLGTAIQDGE